MNNKAFQPSVAATVDGDGDTTLEIIWGDRRLMLSMNPSEGSQVWVYSVGSNTHKTGDDLTSLHDAVLDIAKWQDAQREG